VVPKLYREPNPKTPSNAVIGRRDRSNQVQLRRGAAGLIGLLWWTHAARIEAKTPQAWTSPTPHPEPSAALESK
jgi:hypothetical protein